MFCVAGISVIDSVFDNLRHRKADESAPDARIYATNGRVSGAHDAIDRPKPTRTYCNTASSAAARTAFFRAGLRRRGTSAGSSISVDPPNAGISPAD
jgi:hypothetical protein